MPLNENRQRFVAAYLGEARRNATEAARIAGYKKPGQQGHALLKVLEIQQAIEAEREDVKQHSRLTMQRRLEILDDLTQRHLRLIEARAEGTKSDNIEGGDTGLLVRSQKSVNNQTVTEYSADTAVVKELRELLKQTAIELGEWTEKRENSGQMGVIVEVVYEDDNASDDE